MTEKETWGQIIKEHGDHLHGPASETRRTIPADAWAHRGRAPRCVLMTHSPPGFRDNLKRDEDRSFCIKRG